MRSIGFLCATLFAACVTTHLVAEEPRDLDSYMPLADEFVVRDKAAPDVVFYARDRKLIEGKLKEYDTEFPKQINVGGGAMFILVVSDHLDERFAGVSRLDSKKLLIVDLQADKKPEFKPAPEGKKHSRLLLIFCQPIKEISVFAMKTSDGKQHDVKSEEVKK